MSRHPDLRELQRCFDQDRPPPVELEARLRADPRRWRRARALRRVDESLRVELAGMRSRSDPARDALVLAALAPRAARPSRAAAWLLAAAAGLALAGWLARPARDRAPGPPPVARASADPLGSSLTDLLHWSAPLDSRGLAPEAALIDEAERLADDTRRVARSLWGRLPLASWLARDGGR